MATAGRLSAPLHQRVSPEECPCALRPHFLLRASTPCHPPSTAAGSSPACRPHPVLLIWLRARRQGQSPGVGGGSRVCSGVRGPSVGEPASGESRMQERCEKEVCLRGRCSQPLHPPFGTLLPCFFQLPNHPVLHLGALPSSP